MPEEQALDLVQEVFLRAFDERARLGYDGLRPYRPYLLRIAKNLRIDTARRDGRWAVSAASAKDAEPVDIERLIEDGTELSPPDFEDALNWGERLREMRSFVSALPELEQQLRQMQ